MSTPYTKLTAQSNSELASTDSSMTFHTGSREVLRITNEARLVIGEGLSKDEATQKVANLLITAFDEQIQKMLDKRIASIKSELDRMNHNDTIATEDYLNYGPRNTTPRTDFIAHKGYTERTYICEMTELARILETELATMTARAEKAEDDSKRLDWLESNKGIRWQQWNDILVELDRAAIDAAMKEDSK